MQGKISLIIVCIIITLVFAGCDNGSGSNGEESGDFVELLTEGEISDHVDISKEEAKKIEEKLEEKKDEQNKDLEDITWSELLDALREIKDD